jgi:hypothetical protein
MIRTRVRGVLGIMKRQRQSFVRLSAVAIALAASLGTVAAWPAYADDPVPAAVDSGKPAHAAQPTAAESAMATLLASISANMPLTMAGATVLVGAVFGSAGALAFNRREARRME